jgi:hypothetical protein
MLKFTYTETGMNIERVNQSLEDLVSLRVVLAMRIGQRLTVEPGVATFLLSAALPAWKLLEAVVQCLPDGTIAIDQCDLDTIEVSLRGTWIAQDCTSEEGIFLVELSDAIPGTVAERAEFVLFKLWQESAACQSSVR